MNHPNEDSLLLLAYGELPGDQAAELESHVAVCEACRAGLAELDRARVALDETIAAVPRRRLDWVAVALAAAAVVAVVPMIGPRPGPETTVHWMPTTTWSLTAGYMAGGKALVDIDAQLTRLEQEPYYGRP